MDRVKLEAKVRDAIARVDVEEFSIIDLYKHDAVRGCSSIDVSRMLRTLSIRKELTRVTRRVIKGTKVVCYTKSEAYGKENPEDSGDLLFSLGGIWSLTLPTFNVVSVRTFKDLELVG